MTSECVEIVNWLKNWFTPKDEEYYYDMTVSNYNPTIDSNITVGVYVTDGNGDPVNNHSFQLWIGDSTSVTLTTDSQGYAGYTYNCSDWGVRRFSVETCSVFIKVTGWREITISHGRIWVNGAERICQLWYRNTINFTNTSWKDIETISQIASYPPKIDDTFVQTGNKNMIARVYRNGLIQAQAGSSGSQLLFFSTVWPY